MKSIYLAAALYFMMMGISLGLMFYVSADGLRYYSQFILKQSLMEVAHMLKEIPVHQREELVMDLIENMLSLRKPSDELYYIELLAFSADPIGFKVALSVDPNYQDEDMIYRFEEVVIEVNQ